MAVITEIRNRSALLIGVIGLAMVLFVAGDLLSSSSSLFNAPETDVAEIGGKKISYGEFEQLVAQQLGSENVDENARSMARERVWNSLLRDKILGEEYARLGLVVSPEELFYQIKNTKPNSILYQFFTDPQTGQIYEQFRDPITGGLNTNTVLTYANQLINNDQSENWIPVERAIKEDRISTKYNKLIEKGMFPSTIEAQNNLNEKNTALRVSLVPMYYTSIPDAEVEVTDAEIQAYYNKHKNEAAYKQPETVRGIKYVEFVVNPSDEDMQALDKAMANLKTEFLNSEDDTLFVTRNTDREVSIVYVSEGQLTPEADSLVANSNIGEVFGPFKEGDVYALYKNLGEKISPDSVNARHILIPFVEGDTASAKAKADSLLTVIKRNKNFEAMALEHSEDLGSAQKGGDLDWFTEGRMVKPFNDACFNGKVGDMPIVVSQFGVHLIEIKDQTRPRRKVLVAKVERFINASKTTFDRMYNTASAFSINNNTASKFDEASSDLQVQVAPYIREIDKTLNDLESPRLLIRWAYQASIGDVSEPFELGNKFVVAVLTEIKKEGILPLEVVKSDITDKVLKEKKAAIFVEKMKNASSLDELASKVGSKVNNIPEVTFSSFSIPNVGPEFTLLGKIFAQPVGEISEPVVDKIGVYVFKVEQITNKPASSDVQSTKAEMAKAIQNRVSYDVFNALKEQASIKDNRPKFY